MTSDLPYQDIKQALERGERKSQQLGDSHAESKSLIDEKRVERVQSTDDKGLQQHHEAQQPRQRVVQDFPCLMRVPDLLFDSLIIAAYSLNELDLLLGRGPSGLWRGVWEGIEDDGCGG